MGPITFLNSNAIEALPWVQTAATTAVTGLLIWLITKGVPDMQDRWMRSLAEILSSEREDRKLEFTSVNKIIEAQCRRIDSLTKEILNLQLELLTHDLSTRGLNLTSDENIEAAAKEAIRMYSQLIETIKLKLQDQ